MRGAKPTIIFTGGGYHLLQPLDADIVLEMQDIFKEFISFGPSRRLMQYAEMLMTDNMADPVHNNTVAFSNCMIKIPNSFSKYVQKDSNGEIVLTPQSRVRIEQLSNGYKPNIRYLLEGLWESLIQLRNDEIFDRLLDEQRRVRFEIRHPYNVSPQTQTWAQNNRIDWIERLMEKPLHDFRKYFMNIRRLSDLDTFDRIKVWLEKCSSILRLDFNVNQRVKYDIKSMKKLQRARHFINTSTKDRSNAFYYQACYDIHLKTEFS